jgi:hypothetical protein
MLTSDLVHVVPPVQEPITKTNNGWRIGAEMTIVISQLPLPQTDCLLSWADTGYSATISVSLVEIVKDETSEEHKPICVDLGFIAPVIPGGDWMVGSNMFLRARDWSEGIETEADTMKFVRKMFPEVPMPEVIHSWIDKDWRRSFCLMTRCPGKTVQELWPTLDAETRIKIGVQVAQLCKTLATLHSPSFTSPTGCSVWEPLLDKSEGKKIRAIGLFFASEFDQCLSNSVSDPPDFMKMRGRKCVFDHPDLNLGNILVKENGNVTGVNDWYGSGHYPPHYIAAKTAAHGFKMDIESDGEDEHEYQKILARYLRRNGYTFQWEFWDWHDEWVTA